MFSDLSWGVAIVATGLAAVGLGFEGLGKYLSGHVKSRLGRMLTVWPSVGLGHMFLGAVALTILWNMFVQTEALPLSGRT